MERMGRQPVAERCPVDALVNDGVVRLGREPIFSPHNRSHRQIGLAHDPLSQGVDTVI